MVEDDRKICHICGAPDVELRRCHALISSPFGSFEEFSYTTLYCTYCNEELMGDDYDRNVTPALERSDKQSVINNVNFLVDAGYSKTNIERIFGLPFGTLEKQMELEVVEPALVMLLNIARHYPKLLEEADEVGGFNRGHFIELASEKIKEE